jgi:hypothetical protein
MELVWSHPVNILDKFDLKGLEIPDRNNLILVLLCCGMLNLALVAIVIDFQLI